MSIKVLHCYKDFYPETYGGVERVIDQLCSSMVSVHSEVLTLSPTPRGNISKDRLKIHQVKRDINIASTGISFEAIRKIRQLAPNFDVLHFHYPWPFGDVLHFLKGVKRPTVVTYHSDIVRQKYLEKLYLPLRNFFLGSVDSIVASSPNYFNSSKVLQKFSKKVEVIPFGVDLSSFPNLPEEKIEHWAGLAGSGFFLFLGVHRYYKGIHNLIEAARHTSAKIVIAGEGEYTNELKRQAETLEFDNVVFVGKVSDIDKCALLTLCKAFVFPSNARSEAFGMSLLEAASYAKPLISCEIGTGSSYINIHNETGLVVPPNSPYEIAEAINYLDNHAEVALRMGERSFLRCEKFFSSRRMARDYESLYIRLLNEK